MKKITLKDLEQNFPEIVLLARELVEVNRDFYKQPNPEEMSFAHLQEILEGSDHPEDVAARYTLRENANVSFSVTKARVLWQGLLQQFNKPSCIWILKSALQRAFEIPSTVKVY